MIHANGLRHRKWTSSTLFYYRRSVGLSSHSGRGETQSLSSTQAAPPIAATTAFLRGPVPVVLIFILMLAAGWAGFWTGVTIIFVIAVLGGAAEGDSQQRAQADWESTFRCSRCGNVFVAGQNRERAEDRAELASESGEQRWLAEVHAARVRDARVSVDPCKSPAKSRISRA